MPNKGWIYILINPSIHGLLKIGKTTRSPAERAKELSAASGVATPFVVAYEQAFRDCDMAEKYVHVLLGEKGYRESQNREFFKAPLTDAVNAVLEAKAHDTELFKANEENLDEKDDDYSDEDDDENRDCSVIDYLLDRAHAFEFGEGDTLQDLDEAIALYERAANLGSGEACDSLGRISLLNFNNAKQALNWYKKAIEFGKDYGYHGMAQCYSSMIGDMLEECDEDLDMESKQKVKTYRNNATKCLLKYIDHVERTTPQEDLDALVSGKGCEQAIPRPRTMFTICLNIIIRDRCDQIVLDRLLKYKEGLIQEISAHMSDILNGKYDECSPDLCADLVLAEQMKIAVLRAGKITNEERHDDTQQRMGDTEVHEDPNAVKYEKHLPPGFIGGISDEATKSSGCLGCLLPAALMCTALIVIVWLAL